MDKRLCFKVKGNVYFFNTNDIIFFEKQLRLIYIVTRYNKISFYGNFSDLIKLLDSTIFVKIHRSFIINVNEISKIEDDEVFFINTKKLLIYQKVGKRT